MSFECDPYSYDDKFGDDFDDMYDDGPESGDGGEDDDDDDYDDYVYDNEDDRPIDGVGFADPGGKSALRAATKENPRDCACPQCGAENVLTRIDRQRGYVCDPCADRNEGGMGEY